jgi:glycosyltransferase involved in cell wall biosynthesis
MDKKVKVLAIPPDLSGVGYFRMINPHKRLDELFGEEFDVTIKQDINFNDIEYLKDFDIICVNRPMFINMDVFFNIVKTLQTEHGVKFVYDIDDYWDLGKGHPLYNRHKKDGYDKKITSALPLMDVITTTTELFAKEIRKYNKNVVVIPNAIDTTEKQFQPIDKPYDKIRFGFVMGAQHLRDIELLKGMTNRLPKEVLDKIEIVLCGFDLRGTIEYYDVDGTIKKRAMLPHETPWYEYEAIITDNYKIVSPLYKDWLMTNVPDVDYFDRGNECYRRQWTKPVSEYATHYNEIDVLLAPLTECSFNEYKSQLKAIESGFFKKGIIATNFGPYTIDLVDVFTKGGGINTDGNAILIDSSKNHKGWAKAIEKIVKNPEILDIMRNNLHETVKEKYHIDTTTKIRRDLYKSLMNE